MNVSPYLKRRTALASAGIAAVMLASGLSACVPESSPGNTAEKRDTLKFALSTPVGSWDPAIQLDASDAEWWWRSVYDTALKCKADGSVVPGAAESFELSDDARVLTLKLREGMTFEDGSPVDASSLKASIENQLDHGYSATRVAGVTVAVVDDLTATVTSPEPNGQLPTAMCLVPGILASPKALASTDRDSVPLSSGPYKLDAAASTSGSVYTFRKRQDHWDAASYPYDTLVMEIMPEPTAKLNALKTGAVDVGQLNIATLAEAESAGVTVERGISMFSGLMIGDRAGKVVPALGDVRVRRAINMAVNRDAVVQGLFDGQGVTTNQVFHPDGPAYLKELEGLSKFDIAGAKKLMAEAGYADGFDLELPSWAPMQQEANPLVVQQLGELGIRAKEVPLTGPTAIAELLSGRFPLMYITMPITRSPMQDIETFIAPDAVWNTLHSADPQLTAMVDAGQTMRGEEAAKNAQEINRFIAEQAWFSPWALPDTYIGLSRADLAPESTNMWGPIRTLPDFK